MTAVTRRWRFGDPVAALREVLARGGVVLFPTESSYAVGADPRSAEGVEAVYRLKGRDRGKPLGVVVADEAQALELGVLPDDPAFRWACERWPAALSVLVETRRRLPAMAGAERLSLRVPDHPALRRLLAEIGPLTATSANQVGEAPMRDPREVERWARGADHVVVDGGVLGGGPASTVVSWEVLPGGGGRPRVLRGGRFPLLPTQ
ncbi:MAG TPA: L-threonylcarbamoyladenylate synthase [Thermoanaerobaculia bacterium]|nr:L-threonylcarbamoyladenylate synthase [Thermoanaerobaculia bacterium]